MALRGRRIWRLWLMSAGLLLAACAAPAPDAPPACAVVEARRGAIDVGPTRYVLAPEQSLSHCSDSLVLKHGDEALAWYQQQVQQNRYAPTIMTEMERYYTGKLLHAARESVYAHQQAGRVVVGQWSTRDLAGQTWSPDGTSVQLTFAVSDYQLAIYRPDRPQPDEYRGGGDLERWQITLVYDPDDQRWKIADAHTVVVR